MTLMDGEWWCMGRDEKMILLTAFKGTSSEELVQEAKSYKTLLLPNDKIKDTELLIQTIGETAPKYVICFGQCPNIKNKVRIEVRAQVGELSIETNFDCNGFVEAFLQMGIDARLSTNAGSSFCNQLYFGGLEFLRQCSLDTEIVFVHIPFLKNIDDVDTFMRKVLAVLERGMDFLKLERSKEMNFDVNI